MPPTISEAAAPQAGASDSRDSDGRRGASREVSSDCNDVQDSDPTVSLKLEYLSYRDTKLILMASYIVMLLGFGGVLGLIVLKAEANPETLRTNDLQITNLAVCSVALALMLPTAVWMLLNIARTRRQKWDGLRRRLVVSNFLLLVIMMVLCALIIVPNVLLLAQPCWYFADDTAVVKNLSSCQYGVWNTAFAILVCQVHELNPVGHRVSGVMGALLDSTKRAAEAVMGRMGGAGPAKAGAKVVDEERRDSQNCGDNKAGVCSADGTGCGGCNGAAQGKGGVGGAAGMDVEQGHAGDGMASSATRGSQPPPRAQTVADHSLWHHLPVFLLWVAVTVVLIFGNLETKTEQSRASAPDNPHRLAENPDITLVSLPAKHSTWGSNVSIPLWYDHSIEDFQMATYLDNPYIMQSERADWSWENVTADPGKYLPRNVTIRTGDPQRPTFLHIWGPYNANSSTYQWALQDELMVGSARPSVVDMPTDVDELLWPLASVFVWMAATYEAPFVEFCQGKADYNSVRQAIHQNQDELRMRAGAPLCSAEPTPYMCDYVFICPLFATLTWTGIINIFFFTYILFYIYYLSRAFRLLNERPYIAYRLANVLVRLQMRETLTAFLYFAISMTALFYVNVDSCVSKLISGLGISPLAFVGAVFAVVKCVYSCPRLRANEPLLMSHAQLQQFAWREADAPALLAARGHPDEPLFVLETALKALYYSCTVYHHDQVEPDQPFSLRCAMQLDNMEGYEVLEDAQASFKMIAGYRPGMLVLAFRGTVDMTNMRTNALAMLRRYDLMQGKHRRVLRPYVHRGFLAHWCSMREQVLAFVRRIMQGYFKDKDGPQEVLVTGHSLGGALATLAAYDISCILRDEGAGLADGVALRCYTFGAPRVGNHAFAALYKAAVGETWDVVNKNDVVPKMTKWMRVYKRSGQRLCINTAGDIICRPSFIELNVNQRTFKNSVADHYLAGYCASFAAIVTSQLSPTKALDQGRVSVLALADCSVGQQLLQQLLGLDIEEVQRDLGEEKKAEKRGCLHGATVALCGMGSLLWCGTVGGVLEQADGP